MESLSSYARQFLGQMDKPDVDCIEGLSPAISIDQKTTSKNPRSTVGTVTEIYDYLRLLYARIGIPHCPKCGKRDPAAERGSDYGSDPAISGRDAAARSGADCAGKKGEYVKAFEAARKSGFVRVRADGTMYELTEEIKLDKNKKHNIELVVDRLIVKGDIKKRLTDSLETAMKQSGGMVIIENLASGEELLFSQDYACHDCGISFEELQPRSFSFNNPYGACPTCTGLGYQLKVDPDIIVRDRKKSDQRGCD